MHVTYVRSVPNIVEISIWRLIKTASTLKLKIHILFRTEFKLKKLTEFRCMAEMYDRTIVIVVIVSWTVDKSH